VFYCKESNDNKPSSSSFFLLLWSFCHE
jgi:hypothetical protein